jgi:type I restriction enzyme S subunit
MKKGWEITTLGSVCRFVRGPFGGSLKKSVFVEEGFAVYEQQHAIYDQFEEIRYFIDDAKFNEMQRFEIQPHDLIMSCSGTMGKVAIVPEGVRRGIINQALLKLTPSNNVSPVFLKFWMDSEDFQESLQEQSGGAAIQNVASVSVLKEINIPLPPLEEQQRIVGVLDEAFAGLATAQAHAAQNLQNARALFESHLQSVFTHRGKDWVEKRLEDACNEIFAGGDVPKDNHSKVPTEKHQIPIYTNGEKNNGLYGYTDAARVTAPSVTISARGTIGYAAIRNESYYPAIRLIVAIPNPEMLDVTFLYYAIENMEIGHSGTSIPQLTVPMVRDFSISFPPLAEQERIVTQLDALAAETQRLTRLYEQKQAALAALKKSVLHQAFTGEL